jgi:hypothetical protein
VQRRKRIERLQKVFRGAPVSADVVRDACERFRTTGELPDNVRVARGVLSWCDTGINSAEYSQDFQGRAALIRATVESLEVPHDVVMSALRKEAVYAIEPVREAARRMLKSMAEAGGDPSAPMFVECGYEVPEMTCGSMALTLLGFPECLAMPENAERADVVFAKLRELRERIPDDATWFRRLDAAVTRHRATGELPDDGLLADAVVADAELLELMREKVESAAG